MPALKETGTEHLIKHVKKMIPKKTSQMENDSGYITGISKEDVTDALGYTPPTTNTTYGVATSSALGLVKSGTDITVDSSGNVSVNDDSHNHVISNVDGLQSALDGKSDTGHTHMKSDVGLDNVDNVKQMPISHWNWSPGSGQPSWIWGGNEMANYYVYRPYDLEVGSAKKDGNGNVIADTYLPLSGGTVTGAIKRNGDAVLNTVSDGSTNFSGGATLYDGATLILRGSNQSGIEGRFYLYACKSGSYALLEGRPDGTLKWAGNPILTSNNCSLYALPLSGGTLSGNLGFSNSSPIIRLGDLYINRNGSSNCETHIYGWQSSYPHLFIRQFTNAFQFFPNTTYVANTQQVHIGHSEYRFGDGYFTNLYNSSGIITTSDRNKKNSIKDLDGEFVIKIIEGLEPKSFKFNDGTSGRTHFGIIAQDLEELLESLGISNMDFAPLVKEYPDKEVEIENPDYDEDDESSQKYIKKLEKDYDGEPTYNVRYEEFIMLIVKYCQELKSEIEEMKLNLGGN